MAEYRVQQPGDVMRLYEDLPDCVAGDYVFIRVEVDRVRLSRLGENEDGDLCSLHRQFEIPIADLSLFMWLDLTLEMLE